MAKPVQSILLIEDSRLLRMMIAQTLSRVGFNVMTASDGEEGLRIARDRMPDLVVLDMLLPKLGGAEVLKNLKTSPITAHIPVVVLSSLPKKNEDKLKRVGAEAYFEKSKLELEQNSESLLNVVKKLLADPVQSDDTSAMAERRPESL